MFKSPIELQVEVTKNCNNFCQHCYNFWRYGNKNYKYAQRGKNLFYDIAKKIVDAEIFHVTITGGEPLLEYPSIKKGIDFLIKHHTDVSINSNLTLMTPKIARALKKSGVKRILTSLISYKENYHNKIVNNNFAFKKTVEGIKICINAGFKVSVNMVVTKNNYRDVYKTGKFVQALGVDCFCATAVAPAAKEHFGLMLEPSEIKLMLQQLQKLKREGLQVDTLNPIPFCLAPNEETRNIISRRSCTAGLTTGCIDTQGNLRPCLHGNKKCINILKQDLQKFWAKTKPWRKIYISKRCHGCQLEELCGGGCRYNIKHLENSLKKIISRKSSDLNHAPKSNIYDGKNIFSANFRLNPEIKYRKENGGVIFFLELGKLIFATPRLANFFFSKRGKKFSFNQLAEQITMNRENIAPLVRHWLEKQIFILTD